MIIFLVSQYHTYTLTSVVKARLSCTVRVHTYEWLLKQTILPKATYIFTDRERMDIWQQAVLAQLFVHLQNAGPGYRVLNNPSRVLDRGSLLRRLFEQGFNDFNAYRVVERQSPQRYPVFIRRMSSHEEPLTGLLETPQQLHDVLCDLLRLGEVESDLLVIEYCAEPVKDNLFRKLASFKMGDSIFFYHTVHDEKWLVKQGKLNCASGALYQDEMDMFLKNEFSESLASVFDIANIDYGRVDFGVVKGRIQVYEINTNPHVSVDLTHPNPIRKKTAMLAWKKYGDSLMALDTVDIDAPFAQKFEHRLLKRRWYGTKIRRA